MLGAHFFSLVFFFFSWINLLHSRLNEEPSVRGRYKERSRKSCVPMNLQH